jgi:hypothetical protein
MTKHTRLPRKAPLLAGLGLGAAGAALAAEEGVVTIPFEEADIFFELNDTDGDLGIHARVDGEEWMTLDMETPDETEILKITAKSRLRRQGLTEIFFESAEPSFDDLAPERFFRRFPEGLYEIGGITLDGRELESQDEVSHVMPAPPNVVYPPLSGCDQPAPVAPPVIIDWDPVTTSHPDIGRPDPDIEITGYNVVVEREEPRLLVLSVDLPAGMTSFEIPSQFLTLGDEFKWEIVTRESAGNQTAIESCFSLE